MDYILKQIDENINLYSGDNKVKLFHQIRAEYTLMWVLAYLWNKKLEKLSFGKTKQLIQKIQKPTIGNILNIAKELDIDFEIFSKVDSGLFDYVDIRNNNIGHGYSFDDNLSDFVSQFDDYYKSLSELKIPLLEKEISIIIVNACADGFYSGFNYTANGSIITWKCAVGICDFKLNNLYATFNVNEYFRLSPFIHIIHPRKQYTFVAIEELLLGKLRYNRIDDSTEQKIIVWEEIYKEFSAHDGNRKRTANNTIINEYENNYKSYIDVGLIKDSILDFLNGEKRKSSVCATVWGHGGVGKTATVQNICESLSNDLSVKKEDRFDYIIFLTAKDRRYDFNLAKIEEIDDTNRVVTYTDLIRRINSVIFKNESDDISGIRFYEGRILIIIDDFETFDDTEKQKIIGFIELLDINHHKVIITTRNKFLVIGKEISTNELNDNDTRKFLIQILEKYYNFNTQNILEIEKDLSHYNNLEKVHKTTSGRPLFIFVFANYLIQCGSVTLALSDIKVQEIGSGDEAINFLFGKVYDQLSTDLLAKEIYVTIGLLTPEDRLTSLKSHLKYIVNAQNDSDFENSIGKLVDLKIIEIIEDTFYKVYSKEILTLMKGKLKEHRNRNNLNERYIKIQKYINKDTGEALLLNADNSRFAEKAEEFVISTYKEVIRLSFSNNKIKAKALLNLTDYLYNQRGKKTLAIKTFDDYPELLEMSECVLKFSEYLWSLKEKKNKEKSIEVLSNYFHSLKQKNIGISVETRLQVLALLVLRKCLIALENDYSNQNLKTIYNVHGNVLFIDSKKRDIDKIEPNVRQDVLSALISLVEICYKVPEYKKHGEDIVKYVLQNVHKIPLHIQKQFKQRDITNSFDKPAKPISIEKAIEQKVYRGSIKKNGLFYGFGFIEVDELDRDIYFDRFSLRGGNFDQLLEFDLVDVVIKVKEGRFSITGTHYNALVVRIVRYY